MPTHTYQYEKGYFYFITFACYRWLPLVEEANLYDYLPKTFAILKQKKSPICGFVIMPNHFHFLIFNGQESQNINRLMAETKRFLAYKIVDRLRKRERVDLLSILSNGVQENELKAGKRHQVFRLSFDAKKVEGRENIERVLDYMHMNPVQGKWQLLSDFVEYKHSSAAYYLEGMPCPYPITDFREFV